MSNPNDRGWEERAFPWCGDLNACPTVNLGMSLRDYFAAKAMQARIAAGMDDNGDNPNYEACVAYRIADAMLNARRT